MLKYNTNKQNLHLANLRRKKPKTNENESSRRLKEEKKEKGEPTDIKTKLSKDSQDTKKPTESLVKNVIEGPAVKMKYEKEQDYKNKETIKAETEKGQQEKTSIFEKEQTKAESKEWDKGPWEGHREKFKVETWEKEKNFTASQPQVFAGAQIRAKLAEVERRLGETRARSK